MPQTPLGIVYPDDQGHTRLWEHLGALADSIDAAAAVSLLFASFEGTMRRCLLASFSDLYPGSSSPGNRTVPLSFGFTATPLVMGLHVVANNNSGSAWVTSRAIGSNDASTLTYQVSDGTGGSVSSDATVHVTLLGPID